MSKSSAPLIIGGVCCLLSVSAAAGGYLWYDNNKQCANTSANNYTSDATSNAGCTFGCANVEATNYTSTGTSNVNCTFDVIDDIVGCMDDSYAEYGAEYTVDSDPSSCVTLNKVGGDGGVAPPAPPAPPAPSTDPDTFRPSTYSSEGGSCLNTACRVTTGACPTGFRGIGCSNPVPEACSQAGRHAGCVPFTGGGDGGEADTFRPSTYASADGPCLNTACRVTTGACPAGFRGIACGGEVPAACSQAGRGGGCVPE